jgi:hypothetical protein
LLCLRLAVPVAAVASELTYRMLLAGKYEASQAEIKRAEVPDVGAQVEAQANEGFAERLKRWWAQGTDIGKKIDALKAKADGWVEHMVRLAAVFIVQTVALPLLFLWAMLRLYRILSAPWYAKNSHA